MERWDSRSLPPRNLQGKQLRRKQLAPDGGKVWASRVSLYLMNIDQ
jgi:hypothetical protein